MMPSLSNIRGFLQSAWLAGSLDIIDLNYLFSSEHFEFKLVPNDARPRKGVIIRVLTFFYRMFKSGLTRQPGDCPLKADQISIVFFAATKNQYDSILPVYRDLDHSLMVSPVGLEGIRFPYTRSYFISLVYLPVVIMHFVRAKGYLKDTFRYAFDYYWLTYGLYVSARLFLGKYTPSVVVMSNDHSTQNRTFLQAANDAHITTVYLQHAQITRTIRFPVLSFDYALLDGEDALRKYDALGPSTTQVFLIGSPKHDEYLPYIKKNGQLRTLGLATNRFDPIERVEELCSQLARYFKSNRIILRPHPADWGSERWMQLSRKYHIDISNPLEEHPYEYLQRIDVLIAGDSNIHLEAAQLNVYPLYYDFSSRQLDYYSFIAGGLLDKRHDNPAELLDTLNTLRDTLPDVRERARYYCETINTKNDGQSTRLAGELIQGISRGAEIDLDSWEALENLANLQAYRPK